MAQQAKLLHVLASCIQLIQKLLLIQLPTNRPGKAIEDGPSSQVYLLHGKPGCSPNHFVIWDADQHTGDFSVSLSLTFKTFHGAFSYFMNIRMESSIVVQQFKQPLGTSIFYIEMLALVPASPFSRLLVCLGKVADR